jgi:hypothetical protein
MEMKKAKGSAIASFCLVMGEELFGFFGFRRSGSSGGRFGFAGLLAIRPVVLALEFLDAARRIDELHLAGEERMARRANFGVDVLLGAARGELVATTAGDGGFFVFRVDVFFHGFALGWEGTLVDDIKL